MSDLLGGRSRRGGDAPGVREKESAAPRRRISSQHMECQASCRLRALVHRRRPGELLWGLYSSFMQVSCSRSKGGTASASGAGETVLWRSCGGCGCVGVGDAGRDAAAVGVVGRVENVVDRTRGQRGVSGILSVVDVGGVCYTLGRKGLRLVSASRTVLKNGRKVVGYAR